jgi:hypothetical protein
METMTKFNKHLLIAAVTTLSVISANAREKYGNVFRSAAPEKVMAGCSPAQSSAELSVNNVRTLIFSGSDMWWDLFGGGNPRYGVPKGSRLESTSILIQTLRVTYGLEELDVGGQLKIGRPNLSSITIWW